MLFLSFPSLVFHQIRPSFCHCFSFLLMLAMLFVLISSGRSLPLGSSKDRIYFSNALRDPKDLVLQLVTVPPPMFKFADFSNKFVRLEKRRRQFGPVQAKKYERNCFFSPVQCMLVFRDGSKLYGPVK
ncbi:hypothetical protein niasHT_020182 [Heterodera trifolii]|uniref:Uncharacterized protein n=1 Tax=Heterodera trifolii TaxID=157864 RepID=A0ABD2K4F8_9BILA